MEDNEYQAAIKRIPHLNLTKYLPPVPVAEIISEINSQMDKISPFEYGIDPNKSEQARNAVEYLKEAWNGFCIIDIMERGDHMIDYFSEQVTHEKVLSMGVEFDENGYAIYKPTDVGRSMPTTLDYIYKIMQTPGKTRMSRLGAGKEINWHSHAIKGKINKRHLPRPGSSRATIHIPLISNDQCLHLVTKDPSNGQSKIADRLENILFEEHVQHYEVGEVWLFNSIHYHKAVNNSNQDRYHLLIYFDHMDEKARPFIEAAIKDYTGPTIE